MGELCQQPLTYHVGELLPSKQDAQGVALAVQLLCSCWMRLSATESFMSRVCYTVEIPVYRHEGMAHVAPSSCSLLLVHLSKLQQVI